MTPLNPNNVPLLEGEPQSLLLEAAKQQSYIDAVAAADKLPAPLGQAVKTMIRVVNEAAFVAGVFYERKFAIAELAGEDEDDHLIPQICTIPNHNCTVEGPCNGFPKPEAERGKGACDCGDPNCHP